MHKKKLVAAVASSALLLTAPLTASASGTPVGTRAASPTVTVVNDDVVAPFSLALNKGRVYVADGGTGLVSRVVNGRLRTVATGPTQPGDVSGLDLSRNGRYLAYTTTTDETHTKTTLEILGPLGKRVSADLAAYEARVNPDRIRSYGVDNPSQCVRDAFEDMENGAPVNYTGLVDSHPYAVASYGRKWVVADAGGNDLLWVDRRGRISTAAVLPRQPLRITTAIANSLGLPGCVVGVTYHFEAVPTDVELGRDGYLYVSILAGGPESPALGARSRVYRVDPDTGRSTLVGRRLAGATNLAVAGNGDIYVAELFAGRISKLENGLPTTYAQLPGALSVEAAPSVLWAGTFAAFDEEGNVTAPGTIVKISR
ncbi:MAG TPA: ScyD/ScyE family protein [Propionibacteriaceae bacterium]|jgi:hypothetical protein